MLQQLFFQSSAALDEQRAVNRFVRHPHTVIGGKGLGKPSGNLLWRPVPAQLAGHQLPQSSVPRQLACLGTSGFTPGALIGFERPITTSAAMTAHFPTDARSRSPQLRCNLTQRAARTQPPRDLLPLGETESACASLAR